MRRQRHRFVKHGSRQLVAHAVEQSALCALRLALGGHAAVGKQAVAAFIKAVKQAVVDAFVIKAQHQRAAHADIVERLSARVHHKALQAGGVAVLPLVFLQIALLQHALGIGARPVAGDVFLHEIVLAAFDALDAHAVVAVIFKAHGVEVIHAFASGQILRPIGRIAAVFALAIGVRAHKTVRPRADGQRIGRGGKPFGIAFVGKHRQFAQRHVQFGIALLEAEHHRARIGRVHPRHIGPVKFIHRRGSRITRERVERSGHIFGQHRIAIVKARFRIELERNRKAV